MSTVRMGIIGCGAIAQVQHMPNLSALQDLFEVTCVCDISPGLSKWLAQEFHVPNHTTDPYQLLSSDAVDAVILCHADPKTELAVAAFEAGKHVFIEKPMCFSLSEVDAIVEAQQKAGTIGQVGYMKVYDPAFELAQQEVGDPNQIRFVQVNHLHPSNELHLKQFRLTRFDDIPPEANEKRQTARQAALEGAVGPVSDKASRAFFMLSGSMIHDLYGLRLLLGRPTAVVSTEVWQDGRALTTILEYPSGARCAATWIDLPNLWEFQETLEVYGDDKRVILSYPTGFSRGILSSLEVHEVHSDGKHGVRHPFIDWESPFSRELRHFHACITENTPCRTPVADARHDIALIIDITRAYLEKQTVEHT
ncbi:MAG: Gfo/Idh/MocA family oxidoreductase [bacterium]|nr:Gfo/Idh/MocA family oxidoreductase [bacterium]